jgi:hypothetical protein
LPSHALRKQPVTAWYRLQRAAAGGTAAVLVMTPGALVPAAPWRLALRTPLSLDSLQTPRRVLAAGLAVEIERGRAAVPEELAG